LSINVFNLIGFENQDSTRYYNILNGVCIVVKPMRRNGLNKLYSSTMTMHAFVTN